MKAHKIDFNRDWLFAKDNSDFPELFEEKGIIMEDVILPHTWNADDMIAGNHEPYVGAGWYCKSFVRPDLMPRQRLLLEFEGATNCHKVWVNGGYAGGRNGGFLPTLMDITDFLNESDNLVLVRVDNRFEVTAAMPANIDWNRYGGITQPVWMHVREHAYLTSAGVEINTPEVSEQTAITTVTTHVQEEILPGSQLEIRHRLIAPDGHLLSTTSTPLKTLFSRTNTLTVELPAVTNPELWSDARPILYTLKTEIVESGTVIDERTDRIGYRFFRFDPNEGFVLNGKPTQLRGANIHNFFPGLGNALPERFHRSDMKLMKRMGCNYMRTSHYPRSKVCLDACDELGILVLEEQPYWHGSLRAWHGETAIDNAHRLICDMVRHHRNHPSIIAWNTVNEVMLAPLYEDGAGHLEPNDPRRATWAVSPKEYPYLRRHLQKMVDSFKEADPYRPVSMVVGGAWQRNDEARLSSLGDIVGYNGGAMNFKEDFVGPKTGKPYEFQPDYYKEIYPSRVHIMSEGILNDICFERGDTENESIAWRRNAKYWDAFGARPWFCGGSMWCFTDYSANGQIRLHGAVDQQRCEKDIFYFYEAMWSDHPVLHILGHWNHSAGDNHEVVVFTNCTDVKLTLNGLSLGAGKSSSDEFPYIDNAPMVWKAIPFEVGELKVSGRYGDTTLDYALVTAETPKMILLSCSNEEILADGRDITYIDVTVCDARENRCYADLISVNIAVSGAATLAGPQHIDAPAGLARFAIRSNGQSGDIVINVSGEGLDKATLILRARSGESCGKQNKGDIHD